LGPEPRASRDQDLANEGDIARTESLLGVTMPADLRRLYLSLEEAPEEAIAALDPPAGEIQDTDEQVTELLAWASPGLPDPEPDVYERPIPAERLRELYG
jgi:cell wall assembly regulator SMI1